MSGLLDSPDAPCPAASDRRWPTTAGQGTCRECPLWDTYLPENRVTPTGRARPTAAIANVTNNGVDAPPYATLRESTQASLTPDRGPLAWDDAPVPMPDRDLPKQTEPDF
jgi:hypothetical protein